MGTFLHFLLFAFLFAFLFACLLGLIRPLFFLFLYLVAGAVVVFVAILVFKHIWLFLALCAVFMLLCVVFMLLCAVGEWIWPTWFKSRRGSNRRRPQGVGVTSLNTQPSPWE